MYVKIQSIKRIIFMELFFILNNKKKLRVFLVIKLGSRGDVGLNDKFLIKQIIEIVC